jgi:cytochrome c oxidase subunit 2
MKHCMNLAKTLPALVSALLLVPSSTLAIESKYNLAPPVTSVAENIYSLHTGVFWVCVVIALLVFGAMFWSIAFHRKSQGAKPANFHESTTVEIIWTVIPFIIVILMALPATKVVVAMKDTTNSELTVKATGYQWKWGYDYLKGEGEGIGFVSTLATPREQIDGGNQAARLANPTYLIEVDNPLVVPVDTKVRIITTANDVIHAWMVPAFGVKQDAIPGFVRDTWFRAEKVGTYRGQCAELCGKDHAFMPIVVEVKSKEDYAKWVAEKKKELGLDKPVQTAAAAPAGPAPVSEEDMNKTWSLEELKARGEKIYATNCVACHQATGKGLPNMFPALDGSKVVQGPKSGQIDILLNGKNQMPAWKNQLNDLDIAAVITYTKNSWGNNLGTTVQPKEVAAARKS